MCVKLHCNLAEQLLRINVVSNLLTMSFVTSHNKCVCNDVCAMMPCNMNEWYFHRKAKVMLIGGRVELWGYILFLYDC